MEPTEPIPLERADFWELQAISTQLHALELERAAFLADHAARVAAVDRKRQVLIARLQVTYPGLDPVGVYRPDEEACTLVPMNGSKL
jgi:hypothetical protein